MDIDLNILALIIQEEKEAKRLLEEVEYCERAVLYDMPYEAPPAEEPVVSNRGVIEIDL